MPETVDTRLARLEEIVTSISRRVDENNLMATAERENTQRSLKRVMTILDEWAGIRKMLGATGAMLLGIGGFVGFLVNYFWPRH